MNLDWSNSNMKYVNNGEKKNKIRKIIIKILATNVFDNQPPEQRPTATFTFHANS